MLQLASFMNTLLHEIPPSSDFEGNPEIEKSPSEISDLLSVEDITLEEVHHSHSSKASAEFDLGKRVHLDESTVSELIDACRNERKLSKNTVMKILRKSYAAFKVFFSIERQ